MSISENCNQLKNNLQQFKKNCAISYPVNIIAVTKYASITEMKEIYQNNLNIFGENKVQSIEEKKKHFKNKDIRWVMIGHLQKNKVNKAVELFDEIHSIDSIGLLQKINKKCEALKKEMPGLIQINFSEDNEKFGFKPEFCLKNLKEIISFPHVKIQGIMVMGPNTTNKKEIEIIMRKAYKFMKKINKEHPLFSILSMGMSSDYEIALKNGSNMIRIGKSLLRTEE